MAVPRDRSRSCWSERCSSAKGRSRPVGSRVEAEEHCYRGDFASAERHAVAAMAALPEGSVRWYRAANLVGPEETASALARALCARWSERAARGAGLIVMAQAASGLLVLRGESEDAEALCRRIDAVAERFRGDPAVSATILRLGVHRAILAGCSDARIRYQV